MKGVGVCLCNAVLGLGMKTAIQIVARTCTKCSKGVRPLLAALLIMSVVAPHAAFAQRSGSRIGRNAVNGRRDAHTLIAIIGTCLAERRPGLIRRWFSLLPGSREEAALLDAEEGDLAICMSDDQFIVGDDRMLTYTPRRLRVSAALAMVRRSLSEAPAQSLLPRESDPCSLRSWLR